jgi:lipoate-protein ligase B
VTGLRKVKSVFLGEVPYAEATKLQKELSGAVAEGREEEHLLLLEHPHVFTLGRSAGSGDILVDMDWLDQNRVEVAETDRGGQVTYHGPGQLVGYPIIDLKPDRRDVRRYVRDLQEVLVRTLADYGIEARGAGEQAMIGVWSGDAKVASIGVHLSRWVTSHGFALNVSTDLGFFGAIVPCGLTDVRMASIESLAGERPSLADVALRTALHFGEVFEREIAPCEPAEVWSRVGDPSTGVTQGV